MARSHDRESRDRGEGALSTIGIGALAFVAFLGGELWGQYVIDNHTNKDVGTLACEGVYLSYQPAESTNKIASIGVTPELVLVENGKSKATTANINDGTHGGGNLSVSGYAGIEHGPYTDAAAVITDGNSNPHLLVYAGETNQPFTFMSVSAEQYGQSVACPNGEFSVNFADHVITNNDSDLAFLNLRPQQ